MNINFQVKVQINKPVNEVFKALIEPQHLVQYYLQSASATLETGNTIQWQWSKYEKQDLFVKALIPNQSIVLEWTHSETGYPTTIEILLEDKGDSCRVSLSEVGWQSDQQSLDFAFNHCTGWNLLLLNLKAYLQFGVDLRK